MTGTTWILAALLLLAGCGGEDGGSGAGDPTGIEGDGPPTITATNPPQGATDVPLDAEIDVTFSKDMNMATITEGSFTVGGVTGTVARTARSAKFTPLADLAPSTRYTATLSTAVTDADGLALASAYSWSFTTAAPATSIAEMPLSAGKTWAYDAEWSRTVVGSSIGVDQTAFDGRVLLHVEDQVTWEGRDAWRVVRYDLETVPGERAFDVSVVYLSQTASGLEIWPLLSSEWRRILSASEPTFQNNHFLLADNPRGATTEQSASSTTVPAGSYQTVLARVQFTQTGQYAPEDIFEDRSEHYADGVGLVRASWSFDFDDNDPAAFDVFEDGAVVLTHVDTGPFPEIFAEVETNDGGTSALAQAVDATAIVSARAGTGDPGAIVADPNVFPNADGVRLLQDWYRFERPSTGPFRLDLVHEAYEENVGWRDLDVYLFREDAGGALLYQAASTNPGDEHPTDGPGESIFMASLPSGTYYVAVQAWDTHGTDAAYWFVIR